MSDIELTKTQHAILAHAIDHTGGLIERFPENLKGCARQKVLESLVKRGLVTQVVTQAERCWFVLNPAYTATGRAHLLAPHRASTRAAAADPVIRPGTKQATVLAMLQRPDGATVAQIMEATGWQAHTVRGAFAGAFKLKLGLTIVSSKPESGDRVYRVAAA